MKLIIKNQSFYLLTMLVILMASCSKMNDIQDKYYKDGETSYVGRVDSAKVLSGKDRVMLRYWFSDIRATQLIVYWNNHTDSLLLKVPVDSNTDSVDVIIPNLSERNYTFELVTMNSEMLDRSVPYQVPGNVYGDKYQATLLNRGMENIQFNSITGKGIIIWLGSVVGGVGVDLKYIDTLGNELTKRISMESDTTVLKGPSKDLEYIKYRTLFLPEDDAIDTFYTEYEQFKVPEPVEEELDKSKFAEWNPPGIPYSRVWGWFIENAWDGSLGGNGFSLAAGQTPPPSRDFTFDMGQLAKVTKIVINSRDGSTGNGSQKKYYLYGLGHIRKFSVWGSASPDVNKDTATWVKLDYFESVRPSGLPAGSEPTQADIQKALIDGENYIVDPSASIPPIRYIRFRIDETWGGSFPQLMELTLYGYPEFR